MKTVELGYVRFSIRSKLLTALSAVLAVSFLLILVFSRLQFQQAQQDLVNQRLAAIEKEAGAEFDRMFRRLTETAKALQADRQFMLAAFQSGRGDYDQQQTLIDLLEHYHAITQQSEITVIGPDGTVLGRGSSAGKFGDTASPEIQSAARSSAPQPSSLYTRVDNVPFLVMVAPLWRPATPRAAPPGSIHPQPAGCLAVYADLTDWITRLKNLTAADFILYDQNGQVILTSTDMIPDNSSSRTIDLPVDDPTGPVAALPGATPALGQLTITVSPEPIHRLFNNLTAKFKLIILASFLLGFILFMLVARNLTRPLQDLVQASSSIGDGSFDQQLTVTSADEAGLLGRSFNRMLASLSEYRLQLIRSERIAAWREIARRLAHEIKNPLMPIQVSVENVRRLMRNTRQEAQVIEMTDPILDEVSSLKKMVDEFTGFVRLPAPDKKLCRVSDLFSDIRELYRNNEKNITIETTIDETVVRLTADPEQIKQVLKNLVQNSIDASPGGSTITLSAAAENNAVVILVTDQGCGIDKQNMDKLFTPYWTTKSAGTGLGLAISSQIIRDHGGAITVESVKDQGTTFRIILPG